MSAAPAVPGAARVCKRSFFFALSSAQREFVFRGADRERLVMSSLSLGFGARDEVHVLEAEGANADEEIMQMQVQTTTMLGVQPSLPAVTLKSPVLALPVTFKLRSGPGPLYVSGSRLVNVEEAGAVASVVTAAKSLPTACEEPTQKRTIVSVEPLLVKVEQDANKPRSFPASRAKDRSPASRARDRSRAKDRSPASRGSPASRAKDRSPASRGSLASRAKRRFPNGPNPKRRKYVDPSAYVQLTAVLLDRLKTEIMERVQAGEKLANEWEEFRTYLESRLAVTDPILVVELWQWRHNFE